MKEAGKTNLADFRKDYYEFSSKASGVARNLAFAGIAVVWIFRHGDGINSKIPQPLLFPVALFALTLALDLIHYVAGTITWGIFCRIKEKSGTLEDEELKAPMWLNWGTLLMFWSKIVVVMFAYILLIHFLLKIGLTG